VASGLPVGNGTEYTFAIFAEDQAGNQSAVRTFTESTLDAQAPDIYGFEIVGTASVDSVTFEITADEDSDSWVLVTLDTDPAPTAAAIIAGGVLTELTADTPTEVEIAGLDADTGYSAYAVARDAAGNVSLVATDAFTTEAVTGAVFTVFDSDGTPEVDSITVNFTLDKLGDVFWLVTLSSASAPDTATIISTGTLVSNTSGGSITATGLDDGTSYRISAVSTVPGDSSVVGDIRAVTETTDEDAAIDYSELTYIVGGSSDHYSIAASDWGTWLQSGETEPVTIGAVFRRLTATGGNVVSRQGIAQGWNLGSGNLITATFNGAIALKPGSLSINSGGNASPRDDNFTCLGTVAVSDTELVVRADKAFESVTARTDDLPLPRSSSADVQRLAFVPGHGLVCFWVAKGVYMSQAQQDAFADAVKAGTRIYPEQATSAWYLDPGTGSAPAVMPDRIGSGPDFNRVGTPTVATVTPTFNF
jgi:hypothetical protein